MCRGLAIFFFAAVLGQSAFADFVKLVARAKPAIVQIDVETGEGSQSGTGFFVSSDGYLVTNAHVLAGARRRSDVTVTGLDGTSYVFRGRAYINAEDDIAILKCDCPTGYRFTYLSPDPYDDVAEGETVLVIGNPEGFTGTVSNGLVAAIRKDPNQIQITAPMSPGSSGSPVLNEHGLVIGVAKQIYREGQNLNFAIPIEAVFSGLATIEGFKVDSGSERGDADTPSKQALQLQSPTAPRAELIPAPDYQERVVDFVREFVAASRSGSKLRPPITFYGPNIVFNGRPLTHQAMAQQIQSAFAQWPQRAFHLISGPTVVGPSQNKEGSVVRYELAFAFENDQKRFEGKASVQLTVQIQGDQLAITSVSPKIMEHSP